MDRPTCRTLTPAAIICGIENGGTTLLLDMLKAHPRVYAQFEVGLLLAKSLRFEHLQACQPYFDMLRVAHRLPLKELRAVASAENWFTAYERLLALCLSREKNSEDRKRVFFIDKTPAYSTILSRIMARLPGVPIVAVIRDPRGVYASMKKRVKIGREQLPPKFLDDFHRRFRSYMSRLSQAGADSDLVMLIRYEDVVTNPQMWVPRVCEHIGLEFCAEMVDPGNSFSPQPNSYGKLYPGKIAEFRKVISVAEEEAILSRLGDLEWTVYPVDEHVSEHELSSLDEQVPRLPKKIVRGLHRKMKIGNPQKPSAGPPTKGASQRRKSA